MLSLLREKVTKPYSMTIDEEIAELKKDECWLDQLQVLHATNISSLRSSLDDFRVCEMGIE